MRTPTYCRKCGGVMLAESNESKPVCEECKKKEGTQ